MYIETEILCYGVYILMLLCHKITVYFVLCCSGKKKLDKINLLEKWILLVSFIALATFLLQNAKTISDFTIT